MYKDKTIEELILELEQAKLEVKKRDKKLLKKNKQLNELQTNNNLLQTNNKFISEIYLKGIQQLTFMKTVTDPSTFTSTHEKVSEEHIKKFNVLRNIDEYIDYDKASTQMCTFLNNCKKNNNGIQFDSEFAIQHLVNLYLQDIIEGSTLDLITSGGIVRTVTEKTYDRPDLWALLNYDFRPILPVEMKQPVKNETDSKLPSALAVATLNSNVSGQLYDYMLKEKYFYNQKYIFGILTSLDEWKICWLPNCDKYAKADFLIENDLEEDFSESDQELNVDDLKDERIIHSTKIYKHTDKDLGKIILSVLVKCYNSPRNLVTLLSTTRAYIYLKQDTWQWIQYKQNIIDELSNNINLNIPHGNTSKFTVLRYFNGGKYSKIRLVISDQGNIIVLKEFLDENSEITAIQEEKCWHKINKVKKVCIKTVVNKPTLIMPLVFHAHVDIRHKKIFIPLDLKIWSVEDKALSDDLPEKLEIINQQLLKFKINIREIAEDLIEKCAEEKYVHDDFEFRHMAVRPIIENDKVVKLDPVLIDFQYMTKVNTEEEARNIMQEKLNNLYEEYSNFDIQ